MHLSVDAGGIVRSATKTGRVVVVHEAPRTAGMGAEVVAIVQERALYLAGSAGEAGHRLGHRLPQRSEVRTFRPWTGSFGWRRRPWRPDGEGIPAPRHRRRPDRGRDRALARPEGGRVEADQPVVEVETDKAVVEIPSPMPA